MLIKLVSCLFDFALSIIAAFIVNDLSDGQNLGKSLLAYSAVWISPLVFLNSASWGQCDSIYTFFILLALYSCIRKKSLSMFVFCGIAFAFKFQTVFMVPFLIIIYVIEKQFSIFNFAIIPLILVISGLPGIIMGRSIADPFLIYFKQTGSYTGISFNYNSFWNCIIKDWPEKNNNYTEFKKVAIIFTIFILTLLLYSLKDIKTELSSYTKLLLLHVTIYSCVLFLPSMHERYGYVYEITALILMCLNKKY